MSFAIGVTLFAVTLLLSVAWHECGHMWAAQATGMKVRRYFVGFGPTLWSIRRGETEYGVKALPFGGFCDIAGMTPHEDLAPDERDRAMYKQKAWKRLVVLAAGPAQNLILGFVLIIIVGLSFGLPDLSPPPVPARVAETQCVSSAIDIKNNKQTQSPCTGTGPAGAAGLLPGDQIVAVGGRPVEKAADLTPVIRESTGPIVLTVERDGRRFDATMTPQPVTVTATDSKGKVESQTYNMVGIAYDVPPAMKQYDALSIVPGAVVFTGDLFRETWNALLRLPTKIGALWTAVTGGERSLDTPVSVYGASVLGGQAVERGLWDMFWILLISINFFLALFNLIPLLPLDGGHMAIVGYEKGRDTVRRWFGRAPGGAVDYFKLLPVTYAVVLVMGGFMVLTLTADIINPINPW
ncbi:peptidase M50 [Gordonia bronchialis DSM 43247]|uniref:Zinc metalloprotease Rip1 n=1 Tax=Gordonia bronchialis (strain ATCC 25592 / DSM 43247 / BCRC 13721 / JCM 3198 / KCTC 3076 / NBRC 16047 / NCTC 10667) TaxID=526226 RepID=D0LAQ4_GORB4|nr:M50 family metallopeptidase [Gordonia bronchialis]ACY21367.1 peptidase M50 [Gordonia bronchialis DSM 43247]MCC3324150.1 M50 family metallopeptidase [Gordonia bronchialis]QGS24965.1 zinc metalloprotease [Gordonia bronchialis]UAK38760.1 M50 family metallopeptidase [Gordonia bronchialis]STQ64248.1 Metalloprotease mmpA [Gordonia bronchialis]